MPTAARRSRRWSRRPLRTPVRWPTSPPALAPIWMSARKAEYRYPARAILQERTVQEDRMAHRFAEPARRTWRWALPIVAIGALLIWRPGWFEVLGVVVLGFGVVVFVLMLAVYAFAV